MSILRTYLEIYESRRDLDAGVAAADSLSGLINWLMASDNWLKIAQIVSNKD